MREVRYVLLHGSATCVLQMPCLLLCVFAIEPNALFASQQTCLSQNSDHCLNSTAIRSSKAVAFAQILLSDLPMPRPEQLSVAGGCPGSETND